MLAPSHATDTEERNAMQFRSRSEARRSVNRLLITLAAICLPVFAATFFSGSFFQAGTLRPGEVFDATAAQAAAPHVHGSTVPNIVAQANIQNYQFSPSNIVITVGDSVLW